MLKPRNLATVLAAAVPDLATDPDRFQCYVERGRVLARATEGAGFEYRYQLTLFLLDYSGHPDAVFWPLLGWMRVNQPEQLANPELRDDAIRFEVDLLDGERCNITIELQLAESVIASACAGGGWDLTHADEPPLIDPLDGVSGDVLLEHLRLGTEPIFG